MWPRRRRRAEFPLSPMSCEAAKLFALAGAPHPTKASWALAARPASSAERENLKQEGKAKPESIARERGHVAIDGRQASEPGSASRVLEVQQSQESPGDDAQRDEVVDRVPALDSEVFEAAELLVCPRLLLRAPASIVVFDPLPSVGGALHGLADEEHHRQVVVSLPSVVGDDQRHLPLPCSSAKRLPARELDGAVAERDLDALELAVAHDPGTRHVVLADDLGDGAHAVQRLLTWQPAVPVSALSNRPVREEIVEQREERIPVEAAVEDGTDIRGQKRCHLLEGEPDLVLLALELRMHRRGGMSRPRKDTAGGKRRGPFPGPPPPLAGPPLRAALGSVPHSAQVLEPAAGRR